MPGQILVEGVHTGAYIVSEASTGATGVSRSRDQGKLAAGVKVAAGQILAKNGSGEFVAYDSTAASPAETAVAISFDNYDNSAGAGTLEIVVHVRDMEYNSSEVSYVSGESAGGITAAIDQLSGIGIIARDVA